MANKEGEISYPLFETRRAINGWLIIYRFFSISLLFLGIFSIFLYRFSHLLNIVVIHGGKEEEEEEDNEDGKSWVIFSVGLLGAELFFVLYWIFTQALRWNLLFRQTFKHRLSQRYEHSLPRVDVFVCTADPEIEPPMMVMNTVLSVMAYDYPSEKLSVYLSDDAASEITFYALLEASSFAKHWLPFCKRFNVEPRSPSAYFNSLSSFATSSNDSVWTKELADIKKLYQDMERRIEDATKSGKVPRDVRSKHKAFSQWDSFSSRRDHDTILQILLHRKDAENSKDVEGSVMPTLVYLAREKRPQYAHHFKAGAMNSLIRVSSRISNGKIIMNVDCDMYSNNSESVRDALCFFMDEEKGHEIAYVQFPQNFAGVSKNDLYGSHMRVFSQLEAHGTDGCGGPLYVGTGCFHRRDILCGKKFSDQHNTIINDCNNHNDDPLIMEDSLQKQEQESKPLASCTYEQQNTLWGSQMGLLYGCAVEDVITGLSIQCKGWKSVYYNPERKAFLGAPLMTLGQALVQQKRWAEGEFQILVSKYSPPWYAYGKLSLGLQMVYCNYCFWAPKSLPTLYYCIVPSLCLLKGIPLFPKISSPWFIPFAYVIVAETTYSLLEFLRCGGTVLGWWNEQRMWLYKRTSSYFFAFMESILKLLGFPLASGFAITAKVSEQDASQRYENEIMEFGASSSMFTLLATLALLNLFCFLAVLMEALVSEGGFIRVLEKMMLQITLCGVLVLINVPIYEGLFFRKDKGRLPTSVAIKSTVFALSACGLFKALL